MATEESLIVGVVLVVVGVLSAIYGTILCFTTKVYTIKIGHTSSQSSRGSVLISDWTLQWDVSA